MTTNDDLRIHVINVGHGDSTLVEFPDLERGGTRVPRFGLVDAGGAKGLEHKTREYVETFLEHRLGETPTTTAEDADAEDYVFEFICLTHPHEDHLLGLMDVLETFCAPTVPMRMRPRQFWDSGFRYNTGCYLDILDRLALHPEVQFMRVTSGTEFQYNQIEVLVLAPSVDIRNRYDTYGVDANNGSIVLRLTHDEGIAILSGDAHFDSWGKICEEFPRKHHIVYPPDGSKPDKRTPVSGMPFLNQEDQLKCHLLKVSHHGSKNGTSYEYVHKLEPTHFAISCDQDAYYKPGWKHKFPHPITRLVLGERLDVFEADSSDIPGATDLEHKVATTADSGTLIYRVGPGKRIRRWMLGDLRDQTVTTSDLAGAT